MNIAILSGKGGTGKTTVSTNLAKIIGMTYVDCDVEEPNGFIFMKPVVDEKKEVWVEYPYIDLNLCSRCGACAKACQFHAIAKAGKNMMVFPKLCHDCGACALVCEAKALSYKNRSIGIIEHGMSGNVKCYRGVLNVGEPMAVPIILNVLKTIEKNKSDHIIDCPPGTSCNVVNSLKLADAAILVTEPSQFGFHDLKMAESLLKMYQLPYGVILNKDDGKNNMVKEYCKEKGVCLFGSIPYSKEAAALYSEGMLLVERRAYQNIFEEIVLCMKEAFAW